MPRTPRFPPYPRRAHASGQARITVGGKQIYLSVYGSPESYRRYEEELARWRTGLAGGPEGHIRDVTNMPLTVNDLLAAWWGHAGQEYAGRSELASFRCSLRPLQRLYGSTAVAEFGTRALAAVVRAMATGSWMNDAERAEAEKGLRRRNPGGWCRRIVNRSLVRVRTLWRWAEREELVPAGSYEHLRTVPGLRQGQWGVRESDDVPPVPEDALAAALAQLRAMPKAAVQLLLWTGARPSELLRIRAGEVNTSGEVEVARGYRVKLGEVWAYQPAAHKTAYKGHRRVILFGPKAREVLAPLLAGRGPGDYLFPAVRRAGHYTVAGLTQAIGYACARAGVEPFGVYRLRHSAATRLAAEYGPDLARIVLGQRDLSVTRGYVVDDLAAAARALGAAG